MGERKNTYPFWSGSICGVLGEFMGLCHIPHASDQEAAIAGYICRRGKALGYETEQDESHNVLITIPATEGQEHRPAVMLQAHLDMVVAVERDSFDPLTDTVSPVMDGDYLRTDGRSSLGADNGIGVALMLYFMEHHKSPHGTVKLLFTTGEEVGLKGARQLSPEVFREVPYLINLDGFHGDRAIVGCMSGKRETYYHPLETVQAMPGSVGLLVEITGLRGGHSGEDIGDKRCNAIRLMAEMLACLKEHRLPVELASFEGGTGANVIPRSASVILAVDPKRLEAVEEQLGQEFEYVLSAYAAKEKTPHLRFEPTEPPKRVWVSRMANDILEAIRMENTGVYAMSRQIAGQVGGSSNLGRLITHEDRVEIDVMTRCETMELEEEILHQHRKIAKTFGMSTGVVGYNAWHQEMENPLTDAVKEAYRRVTEQEIAVTVAQVGLEPAYFREKAPWLTMVTLGVDIEDAHSTMERVRIDTIDTLYRVVTGVLEKIQ